MCGNPETQSSARMPKLARMRSQRIVHVVQTEENDNDVSVVTISEDGYAEQTLETVNFSSLSHELKELDDIEGSDIRSIFFEIDLDDGDLQRLTLCESEGQQETQDDFPSRRGSLFSDDEFESIRMKLPKRTSAFPRLSFKDLQARRRVNGTLRSPNGSPPSIASEDSSHSGSPFFTNSDLDHHSILYDHGPIPNTAASSATLFSIASSTSSITCVDYSSYPKSGYDEGGPEKPVGIVAPYSATAAGTRGLDDLRKHGYDFDWARFAGRSEAAHGLSPEDSADLEIFLSRGPNSFPKPTRPTNIVKKSGFEKKLREVLKFVK